MKNEIKEKTEEVSRKHASNEAEAYKAAARSSIRGARHFGGDPLLARNFAEWDR